jgi:hypothetical protein
LGLSGAEYAKVLNKRQAVIVAQQRKEFVLGFRGIVCLSEHRNLSPFPAVVDAYRRRIVVRCEDVIYPLHIFRSRGVD